MATPINYSITVTGNGQIVFDGEICDESQASIYVNETHRPTPPLRSMGRDLLRVGTAVLASDRLALRKPQLVKGLDREVRWQRKIDLRIGVENPEVWADRRRDLEMMLLRLTDDLWTLEFMAGNSPGDRQYSLFQESLPGDAEVVLFSGGLDSTAGLYARHANTKRVFVPVSVYGNTQQRQTQEAGLKALRLERVDVRPVALCHQVRRRNLPEESTQRARAVAYIFLAAAVADACGLDRVVSFEAGPGALNLPMHEAQVGSQNTRATHPVILSRMQAILGELLQRPEFRIELPFLLRTKGEVCRLVPKDTLRRIAALSCSCDEGTHRKPAIEHCGFCTSCLMRRSALYAALGSDDPSCYRPTPTKRTGYYHAKSFRFQALALCKASKDFRELLMIDNLLGHAAAYASDIEGCSLAEGQERIRQLLSRYSVESVRWLDSTPEIWSGMV